MIETVPAQLRYVCTLAFGARLHTRSLDRLVTPLLDAREEFGAVGRDAAGALRGPELDETARREVQLRRFREQAQLAARTPDLGRQVEPGAVVQLSVSSRARFPVMLAAQIAARVGAVVYQAGFVDAAHALALLAERRSLPGHKRQANVLSTVPSYLGSLVERGAGLGYGPRDFGVERIVLGGEVATQGLRDRAARLFGEVEVVQPYAATETFGTGALTCLSGHLHFPVPPGLV